MKLANPQWVNTLQWDPIHPAELCLEHPDEYRAAVADLTLQADGEEGNLVFSDNGRILSLSKEGILIRDLWSVDLNQKKLLTGVYKQLSSLAQEEYYSETIELFGKVNGLLEQLCQDSMQPLAWEEPAELTPIMKAFGVQIETPEDPFERLVDYVHLSREFLHIQLVVLIGVRGFLTEESFGSLCRDFASAGVTVLFVEPCCRPLVENEIRLVIDRDHCELLHS